MIYTKITTCQGYVIEIPLDEGIFTRCNDCDTEFELYGDLMKHVLDEGDLAVTKIRCKFCTAKNIRRNQDAKHD
ncbi:hypothetical protein [Acetoanaerobium noterae]|uniref:hypothetical protein n=1 Tax=Acetoanaerobium noterae TaxID=745369 RepID=UPI0028A850FC|nr:hypothetical protein [Acetoanaerobium noterae]